MNINQKAMLVFATTIVIILFSLQAYLGIMTYILAVVEIIFFNVVFAIRRKFPNKINLIRFIVFIVCVFTAWFIDFILILFSLSKFIGSRG